MNIARITLASILGTLKPAVGGKGGMPAFTWLLMTPSSTVTKFRTCNEHLSIEVDLAAQQTLPEPVAVPYQMIADAVGAISAPTIHMSVTGSTLTLSTGTAVVDLETTSASDFPDPPRVVDGRAIVELDGGGWLRTLSMVAPAVARDTTRPMLASVMVGEHAIAAADGFRAHMSGSTYGDHVYGDHVLLPPPMVGAIVATLKGGNDRIHKSLHTLHASDFWATMTIGSTTISGRLVSGQYPQLARIIEPLATTTLPRVTITIAAVLEALKVAMALRTDVAAIRLELAAGVIIVSSRPTTGASWTIVARVVEVVVRAHAGHASWTIAVNGGYLRDALNALALAGPTCDLIVIDGRQPLGLNNGEMWAVVMPMTVGV